MATDNTELRRWCDKAREILAVVRAQDRPQVIAISRKDLRHIRHGFERASQRIEELKAFDTHDGEAQDYERRYGELVTELERSDDGDVTKAIAQRVHELEQEIDATLVDAHKAARARVVKEHQEVDALLAKVALRIEQLAADLDLSFERKNLVTALAQAGERHYEEAHTTLGLVRHECALATKAMNVLETQRKFTALPEKEQFGTGQWKVKSLMDYQPSGALDIPGSGFSDVCPGQDHVNKSIVEKKIQAGLPGKPVIPAAISPDGKICLLDKHHTFVACMALGRPVQLALTGQPTFGGKSDWTQCTWQKFTPKPMAAAGFGLSPDVSAQREGAVVKNEDWKSIVPWRKGGAELDESDRPRTSEETATALEKVEEGVQFLEGSTAKEFHKLLGEALSVGPVYEQFSKLLGGEGFKIKFDPSKTNAFIDGSTIVLPTLAGKEGKPRSAADLLDALVFESCNMEIKDKFKTFDSEFDRRGTSLATYGKEKAGLEASQTVLRSAKMVYQMQAKGCEVAAQGLANIKAIEELDPGFFKDVVGAEHEERDEPAPLSEREQRLIKLLEAKVCDTRHQADLNPENPEHLKNPQWLKSGEMYHYEKARDMGPMAMATLILKQVEKAPPLNWLNKAQFHNWLSQTAALHLDERDRRPLLFCKLLDIVREMFPGVNLSAFEFNSDMRRVADANGAGVGALPPPPPIEVKKEEEGDFEQLEKEARRQLAQLKQALNLMNPVEPEEKRKKTRLESVAHQASMLIGDGDASPAIEMLKKAIAELG